MINGYDFYFDTPYGLLTLPITPEELTIENGSNNKVVTLINEGDINILKSPSLIEVEFEARFPMRKYPYARTTAINNESFDPFGMFNLMFSGYTKEQIPYGFTPQSFDLYWNILTKLKEEKNHFRFIVARTTPNGNRTWDTNLLMALEELSTEEEADEGDDVIVAFKLKQYKEYSVKILPNSYLIPKTNDRANDGAQTGRYTVVSGDCLWNIAKRFYGDGTKWTIIYDANKQAIEDDAKKHGRKSSSNGHWIYPGLELIIPGVTGDTVTSGGSGGSGESNSSKSEVTDKRTTKTERVKFSLEVLKYPGRSTVPNIIVTFEQDDKVINKNVMPGVTLNVMVNKNSSIRISVPYLENRISPYQEAFKATLNSNRSGWQKTTTLVPGVHPVMYTKHLKKMTSNVNAFVTWKIWDTAYLDVIPKL